MSLTDLAEPQLRRFTRDEYYRMAELGFFLNQRVELIAGRIIRMSPQNEPHARTISHLYRHLVALIPKGYEIRCQTPLAIGDSEPEPDFAVVSDLDLAPGTTPTTASLVIEIAHTTLAADRAKADLYASAKIPEYWIINLLNRCLEVHSTPTPDPASPFHARYAHVLTLAPHQTLQPTILDLPPIAVETLFPRA